MINQPPRLLVEVVAESEDARTARGRRPALGAILGLVCVAALRGCRTYSALGRVGARLVGHAANK